MMLKARSFLFLGSVRAIGLPAVASASASGKGSFERATFGLWARRRAGFGLTLPKRFHKAEITISLSRFNKKNPATAGLSQSPERDSNS